MAAPIRPPAWPQAPPSVQSGPRDTRLAAQKAFFEAALAGQPARSVNTAAAPASSATMAVRRQPEAEPATVADAPAPGSIIDIRV